MPHDLSVPMDVDLEWLECGSGFDSNRDAIVTVETDDGYGRFPLYGRPGQVFCLDEYYEPERDATVCTHVGVVCHEACHEFVERTLGHAVSAREMTAMYRESVNSRDYRGQFFPWDTAYDHEGPAYFHSPMSADGSNARARIARCLASYAGEARSIERPTVVHTPMVAPTARRAPTAAIRPTSRGRVAKSPRATRTTSPRTKRPRKTKAPSAATPS